MSRLIDADAFEVITYKGREGTFDDGVRWLAEQIDAQPTVEERKTGKWIPCSERLPEKEGQYLVTCSRWGAWAVDWNIWRNDPKPSWLWEQGVTAWMPLPEPYREDGEVDDKR